MQDYETMFYQEDGFTLVELLVAISILAVLFGIATLTLSGVGTDAADTVAKAECGVVQAAADIYLADDTTSTITERTSTNADIIESGDTDAEFSIYLRSLPTEFTYHWTAAGDVSCPDVP